MNTENIKDSLKEKKKDADELIHEVIQKVPEDKKKELLGIINGFILGTGSEKKVG